MASLTREDNIDWLWGSLKPWQILHSTLAERQRYGNALDVWELVNQTLNATTVTRRREGDGGGSHALLMPFLGDIIDGDFWRHGGVMESKVKECLNRLKHEEEELVAAHYYHHHHRPSVHRCNTDLSTIASSTQLPSTPRSIACGSIVAADHDDQRVEEHGVKEDDQEGMHNQAATGLQAGVAEASEGYRSEEEEEDDEEEREEEHEDIQNPPYPAVMYNTRADNYILVNSNYETKRDYRHISRDSSSILVVDQCCSPAAGAVGDDQLLQIVQPQPDLEEDIDVCAVCLEKLTHYYEEGVQALACRHAFHTVCIAPWLQSQPHACCPCCRAPIVLDNLPPPLHLADQYPLELADQDQDQYACAGVHGEQQASNDIMGLLADMEAALERLGFRS